VLKHNLRHWGGGVNRAHLDWAWGGWLRVGLGRIATGPFATGPDCNGPD